MDRQTDKRTKCGLCGLRTRFVGSHVLRDHVPYVLDRPTQAIDAIYTERALRADRNAQDAKA